MSSVPNLPGFQPRGLPSDSRRKLCFTVVEGQRVEMSGDNAKQRPKLVKVPRQKSLWRDGSSLPRSTTRDVHQPLSEEGEFDMVPAYEALDGYVLRFFGYSRESVIESNLESERVRPLVVLFYLSDDTIQVSEPRTSNSGLMQGPVLKRQRLLSSSGIALSPGDFGVGLDISLGGFNIKLTDADVFTRSYMDSIGFPQQEGLMIPGDDFGSLVALTKGRDAHVVKTAEKVYNETLLGGGLPNRKLQQFLAHDREVCRFYAVLEDTSTPIYERRPFTIFYFLSDDTIEIREQYPLNCGREEFAIFAKRNKIPRASSSLVLLPSSPSLPRSSFVGIADFKVGESVKLLSRDFFIYDADGFTRNFFFKQGISLNDRIDVSLPEPEILRPKTPPYTGYGSWEDSLASCKSIVPKISSKTMNFSQVKVSKFSAKFADSIDSRRFVIILYPEGELMITEPLIKNSGFIPGKFLEKGVYVNNITNQMVKRDDFQIGNVVEILNWKFEILSAPQESTNDQVKIGLDQKNTIKEIFRKKTMCTLNDIAACLLKAGYRLSKDEMLHAFAKMDFDKDGLVSASDFDQWFKLDESHQVEITLEYQTKVNNAMSVRDESEKIRMAVREIGDVLYQRAGLDKRLIQALGAVALNRRVTSEQIRAVFKELGHFFDQADIDRCVLFILQGTSLQQVNYVQWIQSLVASYQELA